MKLAQNNNPVAIKLQNHAEDRPQGTLHETNYKGKVAMRSITETKLLETPV